MRLRIQLIVVFGLLMAVTTTISGVLSYAATESEAIAVVDGFLEGRGGRGPVPGAGVEAATPEELARVLERGVPGEPERTGDAAGNRPDLVTRRLVGDDSVFTLLGADGAIVVTSDAAIVLPTPVSTEPGVSLTTVEVSEVRYRLRTEVLAEGNAVLTARSLSETEATLAGVRNRLLVIALLITAVAVAVAWFVAGRVARPLQRLSTAAEHITATGDLTTQLETGASGEVGHVAASFAAMVGAFQRSRTQQQQLVIDAGHELRTPLTTIRGNVEMLASGKLTEPDRARALELVSSELEELTNLTTELVELAGDQPLDVAVTEVDLLDVAHAAAGRAIARSGRTIDVTGVSTPVEANAAGLDRAISNLLGNALKFSEEQTAIAVEVGQSSVVVRNTGPRLSDDDLERVFERFYRAATSRSLPGSGLGLAIVASVAETHGGKGIARNTATGVEVGFTIASGQPGIA